MQSQKQTIERRTHAAGKSAYSRTVLKWLHRSAMQIKGAKSASHLYPRAYCIAKPAPLCAVFVTPWFDAEPQVRTPEYSAAQTVHEGVADVRVGDWCAIAYVVTDGVQQFHAVRLPNMELMEGITTVQRTQRS